MIDAEHTVTIDAGIDAVWNYVQDISQWALLFPGCKACEVIDDHHSKWLIKVGAGGLIKSVNVLVQIEQWGGPEQVDFTYQLESEPVVGSGRYRAKPLSENTTEISLYVKVEGSGQMAPMWEAMSKPLLPQMAKSFAGKLKAEIEPPTQDLVSGTKKPSLLAKFVRCLQQWWQTLFFSKRDAR